MLRRTLSLLATVFAAVAVGLVASGAPPGPAGATGAGPVAAVALHCPRGDLVLEAQSQLGPDRPGGPADAGSAVGSFLRGTYPSLAAQAVRHEAGSGGVATYAVRVAGSVVATVDALQRGDSWTVTAWSACNSAVSR